MSADARSRLHPATWPWWLQVLAVYGLTRVVSAIILLVAASQQEANPWTGASPSYLAYTGRMWDASWYEQIATTGYPDHLPENYAGEVQQNAWAFYPLFPFLVRGLQTVTGQGWDVVAPTVALLCGAGAMLVIYKLVQRAGRVAVARRPGLPLATVALVSVFPSATVLQVGYTEALALLLIASALYLLWARRYEWAAVVVVLLGFTRAVALPLAAVVLWYGIVHGRRWLKIRRRRVVAFPVRDTVRLAVLGAVALASGLMWQMISAEVTGRADAYFVTQAAWRGGGEVVPVLPWVDVSEWLAGTWGLAGSWGPVLLVLVLVVVAAMVLSPGARRLGPEMQAWSGAYLGYLVAVIQPGSSLVRFLILAFPLGAVTLGWTRSRLWFWAMIAVGCLGQVWWVWSLWRLVPPSGWPP